MVKCLTFTYHKRFFVKDNIPTKFINYFFQLLKNILAAGFAHGNPKICAWLSDMPLSFKMSWLSLCRAIVLIPHPMCISYSVLQTSHTVLNSSGTFGTGTFVKKFYTQDVYFRFPLLLPVSYLFGWRGGLVGWGPVVWPMGYELGCCDSAWCSIFG